MTQIGFDLGEWFRGLWRRWFPKPAEPPRTVAPAGRQLRMNDFNIDSRGVMRRGGLRPGVGIEVPVRAPATIVGAWVLSPDLSVPPEPQPGEAVVGEAFDMMMERVCLQSLERHTRSDLFAAVAELLIEHDADPLLVELVAAQADYEALR